MAFNKEKAKKIGAIVGNVLIWAFVIFSFLITVMVFSAQSSPDGVPALFGKSLLTVQSDSMKGTFNAGDLIIMNKADPTQKISFNEGDVITYYMPKDSGALKEGDINTHRIVEVLSRDEVNGRAEYVTKGDNPMNVADNIGSEAYTVQATDIIGYYSLGEGNGVRLAGVGAAINFLRSSLGFFLFIVLPLVAFFIYELYRFIALLLEERAKRNPQPAGISAADEEEIKRRAIEEYLKAQQANANASAEAAEPSDDNKAE